MLLKLVTNHYIHQGMTEGQLSDSQLLLSVSHGRLALWIMMMMPSLSATFSRFPSTYVHMTYIKLGHMHEWSGLAPAHLNVNQQATWMCRSGKHTVATVTAVGVPQGALHQAPCRKKWHSTSGPQQVLLSPMIDYFQTFGVMSLCITVNLFIGFESKPQALENW